MSSGKGVDLGHLNGSSLVTSSAKSSESQTVALSPLGSVLNAILGMKQERAIKSVPVAILPPPPSSPPRQLRRVDPVFDLRHRRYLDSSQNLKEACDEQVKLALYCISNFDTELSRFRLRFKMPQFDRHHPYPYLQDVQPDVHEFYNVVEKYQHRYIGIDAMTASALNRAHGYHDAPSSSSTETEPEPVCAAGHEVSEPSIRPFENPKREEGMDSLEASQRNDKPLNKTNPGDSSLDPAHNEIHSTNSPLVTTTRGSGPESTEPPPITSTQADIWRNSKAPEITAEESIYPSTSLQCSKMAPPGHSSIPSTRPPRPLEGCPPLTPQALTTITMAIKASIPVLEEVTAAVHSLSLIAFTLRQLQERGEIRQRLPLLTDELRETIKRETFIIATQLKLDLGRDPYSAFAGLAEKGRNMMSNALTTAVSRAGPSPKGKERSFDVVADTAASGNDDNGKPVATHHEHATPPTMPGAPVRSLDLFCLQARLAALVTLSGIQSAQTAHANFDDFKRRIDDKLDIIATDDRRSAARPAASPSAPTIPGRGTAENIIKGLEALRDDAAARAAAFDPNEENPVSLLDDNLRRALGWRTGTTSQLRPLDRLMGRSEFGTEFDAEFDRLDERVREEREQRETGRAEAVRARRRLEMEGAQGDGVGGSEEGESSPEARRMGLDRERDQAAGESSDRGGARTGGLYGESSSRFYC